MDGHAHAGSNGGHAGGHGHDHGVHGSYRGHALPGVLFLLLGLHWSLAVMTLLLRQMQAHRARPRRGGRPARDEEPAADEKYSALLDAPAMECEAHAPETCCWISPAAAAAAPSGAGAAPAAEKDLLCQPYYPLIYVPYAESLLRCAGIGRRHQRAPGAPERAAIGALLDRRGWFAKLEPLLVLSLSVVGIACELWFHPGNVYWRRLYSKDGALLEDNLNVWQHALMYGAFSLGAFVSLLHSPSARAARPSELGSLVPASMPFAFLGLAFLNEAVLFGFHLTDGRDAVARVDHTLLTYVIFATAAITLCQCCAARARNSFLLAAARAYCTLVQGSWFFGIANNEYAPAYKLDASKPGHVMAVPMIFCIHALGWLVFLLLLYHLVVARGLRASAPLLPRCAAYPEEEVAGGVVDAAGKSAQHRRTGSLVA